MDFYSMMLAKKLNKESGGDVTIESLVVTENGNYSETGKAYSPVVVNVQPTLETLNATVNGTYTPQGDGYSEVNVNVPLPENGYLLESASGQVVNITDAAPLYLQECKAEVEAVQDLHGYDHPWVGGAGKNKCPAYTSTETQYGVTIAGNSEGEISVNGTLDGINLYGFILNSSISLGAGTYTLNGANPNGARLVLYDINDNELADTQYGKPTFTLESTTTAVLRIFVYANVQYDEVVRPMIRLSTETDSTFAPYSNISSISGRSEVAIQRVGKNLIDVNAITNNKFIAIDGTLQNSLVSNVTDYIKVSGESITLSYDYTTLSDITVRVYAWYDENKKFISSTEYYPSEKTTTITIPNNTKYIRITFDASVTQLQLELGSTATTYEPFQGKTYTIQLGQTVYGGQLDVTRGKMVVDKIKQNITNAMVFSKRNTADSNKYRWAFVPNPAIRLSGRYDIDVISNALAGVHPYGTYGLQETRKEYSISGDTNDNFINIYLTGSGDQQELTDFLNNNDVYCVYELATPFTIDLTPQQIRLLEGTNNLSCNTGDLNIEYLGKGVN